VDAAAEVGGTRVRGMLGGGGLWTRLRVSMGTFKEGVYIGWVWRTCSRSISSIESLWFDGKRSDCIN